MKNLSLFLLAVAILSASAQAIVLDPDTTPKNGTFELDSSAAPPITFDPYPLDYDEIALGDSIFMYSFAANGSSISGNFGRAQFTDNEANITKLETQTGDLGIRVGNYVDGLVTFDPTVITLSLSGNEGFDVFLPALSLNNNENIYFWVAKTGSTYYANDLLVAGLPNVSATAAMAIPNYYRARAVPEPATIIMLSLGTMLIVKKR